MIKLPLSIFTKDESLPFFIHYGSHDECVYLHSHEDFFELVIVLSGSAEHIVDNEHYRIRKGDVFVIGNDTEHGYDDVEDFRICNIMFKPSFIEEYGFKNDIAESTGFQALFVLEPHCTKNSHFCSRLKLGIDEYIMVHTLLDDLVKEYNEHLTGWKTMVRADFFRLCIVLSRLYNFDKIENKTGTIQLASAIAHIEKNYTESISIAYLAKLSNYSQRQFVRIFKEAFHCIPMVYITNLRMKKARELLKTSGMSVTEVASYCGYDDSNYFSRVFKKYNSMSPTEYIKKF